MLSNLKSIITKRQLLYIGIGFLLVSGAMKSCIIFNYNEPHELAIDYVCGKDTDKSEAYEYNYKGKKYYFDTYNCKQIFRQDPQKFIDNKCVQLKQ